MNKNLKLFAVITILSVLTGCSASKHVVPLNWRDKTFTINMGGPLSDFNGNPYPIPLVDLTYSYGYTNRITTHGSFLFSPAVEGIVLTEWGFLNEWLYHKEKKIGLTTNQILQTGYNIKTKTIIANPQIDLNLYWHFWGDTHFNCDCPGDRKVFHFLYIGASNFWRLTDYDYFELSDTKKWFITPHFGYNLGKRNWKVAGEIKNYFPFTENIQTVEPIYNPISNFGAYGLFFSFTYFFNDTPTRY